MVEERAEDAVRDRSARRRLWWIAVGLSLGPAVSNGLARFAYGLLLPAMRADLGWSYAEAGWINTANSIGYLLGSLLTLAVISLVGSRRLFVWGMALTVAALAGSALTRDLWALGVWRIVAGVGGAPAFIAGGAIASSLFRGDPRRSAMAIAVYFGGGGLGMLVSGLGLPHFIDWFGQAGWPLGWLMLALAAFVAFVPSAMAAEASPSGSAPSLRAGDGRLPVLRIAPALVSYFLFGLGYLIYVTFLVAWMRDTGAGTGLIAAVWAVMGLAVMLGSFVWRPVLAAATGGQAIALASLATGLGIALPIVLATTAGFVASAALFGASFFMVPGAVTAFSRRNLAERHWGTAIALFTVIFSLGQIIGPVAAGALSDRTGSTGEGLMVAAAILGVGAIAGLCQRPLTR